MELVALRMYPHIMEQQDQALHSLPSPLLVVVMVHFLTVEAVGLEAEVDVMVDLVALEIYLL